MSFKSPRRLAYLGVLLLTLLIVGYSVWWWQAARMIERNFFAWVEHSQASGATINHSGLTVEGYPFALRARLEAPHLATRGMEWKGERLLAQAPPWDYRRVDLALPGEQTLYLASAGNPPVSLTTRAGGTGVATLSLTGQLLQLDMDVLKLAAQVDFHGPAGGDMANPDTDAAITAEKLKITALRPDPMIPAAEAGKGSDTGLTFELVAEGVTLPNVVPPSLGRAIQTAKLSMRIVGDPPRLAPASLSAWTRNGGIVELDRLAVDWGPAALAMSGTLALDQRLQPQAAFSAELSGADAVLEAIRGSMKPREFTMARGMVGMLSRPKTPNGPMVLAAPLTVQDGGLFVGPLKVASLPPLRWTD